MTLFLLLFPFSVYTQDLSGDGSPSNPYKISSAADWDRFTDIIAGTNEATKQSDACAIMIDNVPNATERANGIIGVSTMVNSNYQGTFNGAGHTLTISYGTEDNRVGCVSPFMGCQNATIKFLHVDGNIYTKTPETAGIVNYGKDIKIISCRSSVYINSSSVVFFGIVTNLSGTSECTNCLFDGELVYSNTEQFKYICGCFLRSSYNAVYINNCLVKPKTIQTNDYPFSTFYDDKYVSSPHVTLNNSYYSGLSGENQGIDASSMTPEELVAALGPAWMIDENNNVVPIMDISNIASTHVSLPDIVFWQGGEPITLDYKVTDFENNELIEGTHYTATITKDGKTVSEIIDEGDYLLTLTATTDGGYTGKKTQKFHVGDGLSKDENGNYYVVMPEIGSKTVMPRGKEDGFSFTIYNPRHPNGFGVGTTSDGSIIINAQGYTMSINGKIECNGSNDWVDNAYFEFYNGIKANNSSPSYTTEGSNFHSQSLQFTPEGEQTEICFTSGSHHEEHFYLTVTLTAIPYNITYYLNGGTPGEGHFTTYTTDMDYLPVTPIREGYVFAGWYTKEDFSSNPLKSLRGLVGDKTFYARWKKDLATNTDISISTPEDVTYNGSEFTPAITVTDGKTDITNQCTITYTDNINAGKATITITAKDESNDYGGVATREFTIKSKNLINPKVTLSATSFTYTGKAIEPEISVADGETTLVKGIDYTVTFSDNINVGTAKISITFKGNYSGEVIKEISITNPSTPVSSVTNSSFVNVWSFNHTIYIENAPDTEYKIIDTNGRVITTSKTKSTREEINVNNTGVLIVILRNQSFKLAL